MQDIASVSRMLDLPTAGRTLAKLWLALRISIASLIRFCSVTSRTSPTGARHRSGQSRDAPYVTRRLHWKAYLLHKVVSQKAERLAVCLTLKERGVL